MVIEFAGGQLSANVCVLADKGVRRKWEEDFSKTYLSPVLKVSLKSATSDFITRPSNSTDYTWFYLNSVSEQIWFLILFIFSLRKWETIWNLWIKNWQVTRDWVSHLQVIASQTIPSISFLFLIVMFYWDNCPVSAGSDPLLCLLFEIDVPSEHSSPCSLHNVAAVWRYRSQINMEHLLHTVQVQVDSHKVLFMFLKEVTSSLYLWFSPVYHAKQK